MERLNATDRRALASLAHTENHSVGSVICQEGDPGDALYVVVRGRVAILKEMQDGRDTLLGVRGPGEILGEMSLVGQQPRFASLVAAEATDLLHIKAADFSELMDRYPIIGWAILNVLNDRLHESDLARTTIIEEEEALSRRLQRLSNEAERLAELARVRQETIELIAHDLRTPLAVIDGCLDLLRESLPKESGDSVEELLVLAERSAERLTSLLEQLLSAARREAPDATMARQPIDLRLLLHHAVENAHALSTESGIELSEAVLLDLPQPVGDAGQLERVMANLLDNAMSYTPSGGKVVVSASGEKSEVRVSVTDTGPGIPSEHREVIFERFTRVPGVQGKRQGFGLGLYFCRQVVKAHGGRIWVEPGPDGIGSRFVFVLPVEKGRKDG
jgi:signal transduction histidine kinase